MCKCFNGNRNNFIVIVIELSQIWTTSQVQYDCSGVDRCIDFQFMSKLSDVKAI